MALKLQKKTSGFGRTSYLPVMDALEPGDKVAWVHHGRTSNTVEMYTVARRTKTQIIATDTRGREVRFRAEDGSPVGDSRYSHLQAPCDPEVLDALESMRLQELYRHLEKLMKEKTSCHDSRFLRLADIIEDTTQAQKDLVEIRSAQHEWLAAVADV
jgi:hypothetical protein